MSLNIYELDPARFHSASRLTWQAGVKKTKAKLDLLTDIDMLIVVGKGIREGIGNAINRYAKTSNEYIKVYDKNIKSSYFKYWDVNNLHGWAMSKELPVNGFKWVEDNEEL